jgi:DNA-binding MarR family transcriptional regulator
MSELKVLQAIRLKGRVTPTDLAATLGEDPRRVAATIAELTAVGLLIEGKMLRISPDGRERLNTLLAEERSGTDTAAITAAYHDFRVVNTDFKALVSDWQLKDGVPNTHGDAHYDAAVLHRLDGIHKRVVPIIAAAARQVPRLSAYSDKLAAALEKVKAGEAIWLTRPTVDSYHTVWFELHEELILAAGLTRDAEAKAGHAQ